MLWHMLQIHLCQAITCIHFARLTNKKCVKSAYAREAKFDFFDAAINFLVTLLNARTFFVPTVLSLLQIY